MVVLRWLLTLPAAFVGEILIRLPLYWILYEFVGKDDSILQLSRDDFSQLVLSLLPLVGPFGFVSSGAWMAPSRRLPVAIVLALIQAGALTYYLAKYGHNHPQLYASMVIAGFIAGVGVIYRHEVRAKEERRMEEAEERHQAWLAELASRQQEV